MCQEGIRMGRRTTAANVEGTSDVGNGNRILGRRPDRLSLVITYAGGVDDPLTQWAIIHNGHIVGGAVLGLVHFKAPVLMLTVEQHGELVTGEVWATTGGASTDLHVTEVYFTEELAEVARP